MRIFKFILVLLIVYPVSVSSQSTSLKVNLSLVVKDGIVILPNSAVQVVHDTLNYDLYSDSLGNIVLPSTLFSNTDEYISMLIKIHGYAYYFDKIHMSKIGCIQMYVSPNKKMDISQEFSSQRKKVHVCGLFIVPHFCDGTYKISSKYELKTAKRELRKLNSVHQKKDIVYILFN